MRRPRRLLFAWLCTGLAGCALLGKSDPNVPRYFTPEYDDLTQVSPADPSSPRASEPTTSGLRLRLGKVVAWSHLRERMVRNTGRELFLSDELRWTEPPEVYLRRALSRALFERQRVAQVMSGKALTLEVELIAFEEIVPKRTVRLQALILLHDERTGLMEQTVSVEQAVRPVSAVEHPLAVVEALSVALQTGVSQIAERVVAKLIALSPPPGTKAE